MKSCMSLLVCRDAASTDVWMMCGDVWMLLSIWTVFWLVAVMLAAAFPSWTEVGEGVRKLLQIVVWNHALEGWKAVFGPLLHLSKHVLTLIIEMYARMTWVVRWSVRWWSPLLFRTLQFCPFRNFHDLFADTIGKKLCQISTQAVHKQSLISGIYQAWRTVPHVRASIQDRLATLS